MEHEFKKGDIVRITAAHRYDLECFAIGDKGKLRYQNPECGCWVADFNGLGNPEVLADGIWTVGRGPGKPECSNASETMFELAEKGTES